MFECKRDGIALKYAADSYSLKTLASFLFYLHNKAAFISNYLSKFS